eukprot:Gb_39586 [translate_table: standard]
MMLGSKSMNKIKCIIKKWQKFARIGRSYSSLSSKLPKQQLSDISCDSEDKSKAYYGEEIPKGFQIVYVGKSRRRYAISSHYLSHPLLSVLIQKSEACGGDDHREGFAVACEVVLFEHLLWMLENADPLTDSLEELAEFYAY